MQPRLALLLFAVCLPTLGATIEVPDGSPWASGGSQPYTDCSYSLTFSYTVMEERPRYFELLDPLLSQGALLFESPPIEPLHSNPLNSTVDLLSTSGDYDDLFALVAPANPPSGNPLTLWPYALVISLLIATALVLRATATSYNIVRVANVGEVAAVRTAETLLRFVAPEQAEGLLGDLNERFRLLLQSGDRGATAWYRRQLVTAAWLLTVESLRRCALRRFSRRL